jgi:hypothetical protein
MACKQNVTNMKINQASICNDCTHLLNCALTLQKQSVFDCSEYDGKVNKEYLPGLEIKRAYDVGHEQTQNKDVNIEQQIEMAI